MQLNVSSAPLVAGVEVSIGHVAVPGQTSVRLPSTVLFGSGTIDHLGSLVSGEGCRRALVCSDPGVSGTPAFDRAMHELARAGITIHTYLRTPVDVPVESVLECVDDVSSANVDVVVGIGGGSVIDLAKLAALLLSHPRELTDYYGENQVPAPCLPVIAVPTTAGTGSEVSPVAVLSDPARRMKVGVASRFLIPRAAICDPQLTLSCPAMTTAYAGIDALVHAVEAYTAGRQTTTWEEYPGPVFRGKNDFSDLHALTAIRMIHAALKRAVSHGDDLDARTMMLFGSLSAGIAFAQAGTAGAHALQYPIGATTSTPHGLGVGLLIPYVLDFICPAAERELAIIGRTMGVCDEQASNAESASRTIEEIAQLALAVGVPGSLAELGISELDLLRIADDASTISRLVDNSPRKLDRDALIEILRAAWSGERTSRGRRVDIKPSELAQKDPV